MNLTESLNLALPELPARSRRGVKFRMHPKMVACEQVEGGERLVNCVVSGTQNLFRFPPFQWELLQLFDGVRTYEEISDLYAEKFGQRFAPEEIKEMAETLDNSEFWYDPVLRESTILRQTLTEERQKRKEKKSKYGDVSHLQFSAWDPDTYLDTTYKYFWWVYSRWFTLLSIALLVFMSYVFVVRWDEIGVDTLNFYNFTKKSGYDLAEFWVLCAFVLFLHETGHGLTCKHYGGHVHRMGFHLIYFTPAFFTDVVEIWVVGDKWQRLVTIIAGAWTEMMVCAVATPLWWGTPYGSWLHDLAYKLILITGLGVIFFNYNPLIKLDGYFFLTELIEIPELKEEATAYLSGLTKKYLWRMPVEVPYVPKRRRPWYILYAAASGFYSYLLLFFFARFVGNIAKLFTPTWAFIPAALVGLRLFKTRIQKLMAFTKQLYLDKQELIHSWRTPGRGAALAAALILLLLVPWPRDSVQGRFVLVPAKHAVIRAAVPGAIISVNAAEGTVVEAGAPILRLRNLQLESDAGRLQADLANARARAVEAEMKYVDFASAQNRQEALERRCALLDQQLAQLNVTSPITGTVMTPRLSDRIGSYAAQGDELAEVGSLDRLLAIIYVPEFDLRKVEIGAHASVDFDSLFGTRQGTVTALAPSSSEIAPGLIRETEYKGIRPPSFYVANIVIDNAGGELHPGMAGTARIYAEHISLARMGIRWVADFVRRKIW